MLQIIVKVQPEDGSNKALSIPTFLCKSNRYYLIFEGLSDFGLEVADFLVVREARHIVITSESKNTKEHTNHRISIWRGCSVSLAIHEEFDLSHQQKVNALL